MLVGGLLLLKRVACQDQPGWLTPTFDATQCPSKLGEFGLNDPAYFATTFGGAVFWSTDIDEEAHPNPGGPRNMKAAQAWAGANNKMTLEMTVGGKYLVDRNLFDNLPGDQAAFYWNCASQLFARGASGIMHAFARQLRTKTPYGNGIPTFYNIELPAILDKDRSAQMVFHYNANNGEDIWYYRHYTHCAENVMGRYSLDAYDTFAEYQFSGRPYPDYGLDDHLGGDPCPP